MYHFLQCSDKIVGCDANNIEQIILIRNDINAHIVPSPSVFQSLLKSYLFGQVTMP